MTISSEELEDRIRSWYTSRRKAVYVSVSRWHWRWMNASVKGPDNVKTPIVDGCKYLISAGAHSLKSGFAEEDIKHILKIIQALKLYADLIKQSHALWQQETKSLHLYLLLQLLPEEEFIPTARQLGVMVYNQGWLKNHLHPQRKLHPGRRTLFRLASIQYQSVTFPGSGELAWRDEYSDSAIWGAYHRIPFRYQGSLTEALNVYCGENTESRADFCRLYFNGHSEGEVGSAIERVLNAFVIPCLYNGKYSGFEIEQLLTKGLAPNRGGIVSILSDENKNLRSLIQAIMQEDRPKNVARALKTSLPWR